MHTKRTSKRIWQELFGEITPENIANQKLRNDCEAFISKCSIRRSKNGAQCLAAPADYFNRFECGSILMFALWNPDTKQTRQLFERCSSDELEFLADFAPDPDGFIENFQDLSQAASNLRRNQDFKLLTRNRKPGRALYGELILYSSNPGITWMTELRVVEFDANWAVVLYWEDWEETSKDAIPYLIGFVRRAEFLPSLELLIRKNMGDLAVNHPDSSFNHYGPIRASQEVQRLCCHRWRESFDDFEYNDMDFTDDTNFNFADDKKSCTPKSRKRKRRLTRSPNQLEFSFANAPNLEPV